MITSHYSKQEIEIANKTERKSQRIVIFDTKQAQINQSTTHSSEMSGNARYDVLLQNGRVHLELEVHDLLLSV